MSGYSKITTLTFSDFVDTTERLHAMGHTYFQELDQLKSLFIVSDMTGHTPTQQIHDEYDSELYARLKIEGGDKKKVKAIKGWSKTVTMRRFAAEIDITWEMRNKGKDAEVVKRLTNLAKFCPQRLALDLTHVFTFATSTSYTDMDGETVSTTMGYTTSTALVDSTHDLTGTTTTYSNVITGSPAFSKGAYQVARAVANVNTMDNFGNIFPVNCNTIVTGNDPATIDEVLTLKRSTSDPTQNNPGVVNNYYGEMTHVVLPRLATTATGAHDSTKTKWWFAIDTSEWQAFLDIHENPTLQTPATGNNGEDIHSQDWSFGTTAAWGIGVLAGRGLQGSCP